MGALARFFDETHSQTRQAKYSNFTAYYRNYVWFGWGERLKIMGFSGDWMRPTLKKLGLAEMPSVRQSHAGLQKNSSKPTKKFP